MNFLLCNKSLTCLLVKHKITVTCPICCHVPWTKFADGFILLIYMAFFCQYTCWQALDVYQQTHQKLHMYWRTVCFNLEAKTKHQNANKDVLEKRAVYTHTCTHAHTHDLALSLFTQSFVIVISYLDTVMDKLAYLPLCLKKVHFRMITLHCYNAWRSSQFSSHLAFVNIYNECSN
jgi:hypothetical protein